LSTAAVILAMLAGVASAPDARPRAAPVRIGRAACRAGLADGELVMAVPDVKGSYVIPYIQSARELPVAADFGGRAAARIDLALFLGARKVARAALTRDVASTTFRGLAPGEYVLRGTERDANGKDIAAFAAARVGVGTVVAAVGDSITEGYWSHAFLRDANALNAGDFPPSAVSKDGRNFPQFGPTMATYRKGLNCFQSWMTDLNDLLSGSLGWPVFIANEGWGGITSGGYLKRMRQDANWQRRMELLAPDVWLVHLGVNDERQRVPAEAFEKNMRDIVELLVRKRGAEPRRIFLARPSYDYQRGAQAVLEEYCRRIDAVAKDLKLSPGPDFFSAFASERAKWYGGDPVHPNVEGMKRMAALWCGAVAPVLRKGRQD